MSKVLVIVANKFEDVELIATLDVLKRSNIDFDIVSVEEETQAVGQNIAIVPTRKFKSLKTLAYDALFIPGGPGHKTILNESKVGNIVKHFHHENKIISAICAAPEILKIHGILDGVKYTSYPGFASGELNTGKPVEVFNNIVTGRDYKATIPFATALVKAILQNGKRINNSKK